MSLINNRRNIGNIHYDTSLFGFILLILSKLAAVYPHTTPSALLFIVDALNKRMIDSILFHQDYLHLFFYFIVSMQERYLQN